MIVTSAEAHPRTFHGVSFLVLAVGQDTMVTKMLYVSGNRVPMHSHPNEQSGYVVSGRYRLRFLEFDQEIGPGDSYAIPADTRHSLDVIEPGEVVDVFAPPRKDYLVE